MAVALTNDLTHLEKNEAGIILVAGTRVPLDAVVAAWEEGASAEEITDFYPVLGLADVYGTIAYYLRHRAELDRYLAEQRQASDVRRAEAGARFDTSGLKAKLLERLEAR